MSIRTLEENIRLLDEATKRAKAATREANGASKAARETLKALQAEHDRWAEDVRKEIDEAIARQIKMGLEQYAETIKTATQEAHDRVISEFDRLANIMMYGNDKGKGHSLVDESIRRSIIKVMNERERR